MTSAQLSSEKLSIAFSVGHSAQLSSTKLTLAQLSPAQLTPAQLSYAHPLAKLCLPRLSSVTQAQFSSPKQGSKFAMRIRTIAKNCESEANSLRKQSEISSLYSAHPSPAQPSPSQLTQASSDQPSSAQLTQAQLYSSQLSSAKLSSAYSSPAQFSLVHFSLFKSVFCTRSVGPEPYS